MTTDPLSATFSALADPTRRAILKRLARGQKSVTELAAPFRMTLPAVSKHLKVLAKAGLIERGRDAQWRPCTLRAAPLKKASDWIGQYRRFWEDRLDRLDDSSATFNPGRMTVTNPNESTADREIELTRVFDAPRDLVWKAWTELDHLSRWWGPQGFTTTTRHRDLKPGGAWRYVMHGPDGRDYENVTTFLDVVPPERLTYTQGGEVGCEPVNFHVTVTFEQVGDRRTKLTMKSVFASKDARDFVVSQYNAVEGGKQHLARLGEHLRSMQDAEGADGRPFVLTRVYAVPIERMWAAWTQRDQLMKWFGPKGFTLPRCTLDLKPGGTFHYCMRGPDGHEMWGKWTFRQIIEPDRLEFLVSFADETGRVMRAPFDANWPMEMLSVVTFARHAGIGHGTVVRVQWTAFGATEAEQNTFDAGHDSMGQGWTGTFDSLGEFLKD